MPLTSGQMARAGWVRHANPYPTKHFTLGFREAPTQPTDPQCKNNRHLEYWVNQPVDVYLVIRQQDERTGEAAIRWMNATRYLKGRKDKDSRQIIFTGEKLDAPAVWRVRDGFFGR